MKKVALVVGYDPHMDRDAVGQYSDQLYNSIQNNMKDYSERLSVDLIRFKPKSTIDWIKGINDLLKSYDLVHVQYPFESWGNSIFPAFYPPFAKIMRRNKKLIFTFHEWNSVHPLRKLSMVPAASMSDGIIFVSNNEKQGYIKDPIYKFSISKPKTSIIPIGVNLNFPIVSDSEVLERRNHTTLPEKEQSEKFDFVIGYFGFIYEWKQPYKIIETVRILNEKGLKTKLVMAGDFPSDHIVQKNKFLKKISELNINEFVDFQGFVEDEKELALIMKSCDLVMLLFNDGVSARRSSFWYILELGIPLLTTAPQNDSEFDNLIDLPHLREENKIMFTDPNDSAENIALSISSVKHEFEVYKRNPISPKWSDIAYKHLHVYANFLNQ